MYPSTCSFGDELTLFKLVFLYSQRAELASAVSYGDKTLHAAAVRATHWPARTLSAYPSQDHHAKPTPTTRPVSPTQRPTPGRKMSPNRASSPARGTLQTPIRWQPVYKQLNPAPPRGGAQKLSSWTAKLLMFGKNVPPVLLGFHVYIAGKQVQGIRGALLNNSIVSAYINIYALCEVS